MASLIEIANDLAKKFVSSQDKSSAVSNIITEINNLVYDDTNQPLNYSSKAQLVELIGEFVSGHRPFQYKHGGLVIRPDRRDNTMYLGMVDYILGQLKPNKQ